MTTFELADNHHCSRIIGFIKHLSEDRVYIILDKKRINKKVVLKNNLKAKLIKEINEIPEENFDSIYRILHCLRVEFTKKQQRSKQHFSDKFLQTFGSWKDNRSTEQIITDIYTSRSFSKKDIQW